jgi:hypothetical protein
MFVSDIILYDQDRTGTALFAADDRAEVCKINISSSDDHRFTLRCYYWSAAKKNM